VQPDLLRVGEPARCDIGCAPVIGHRSLGPAAAGILFSQLRGDHVCVIGVEQLESLGDSVSRQHMSLGVTTREGSSPRT